MTSREDRGVPGDIGLEMPSPIFSSLSWTYMQIFYVSKIAAEASWYTYVDGEFTYSQEPTGREFGLGPARRSVTVTAV